MSVFAASPTLKPVPDAIDATADSSSTFVTRLKVGEILIDAKGVSRLVSRRIGVWPLALFGLAALAALLVAVLASPALRNVFGL